SCTLCRDFAQAACWLGLSRSCCFRSPAPPLRCWCLRLECVVLAHELADADLPMGVACVELVVLGLPVHVFFELFADTCVYLLPLRIDFARKVSVAKEHTQDRNDGDSTKS